MDNPLTGARAMILAAGLGTRLRPFTDHSPKALYPVEGKTLLDHSLDHLKMAGIKEVIINVHHFADQIRDFLAKRTVDGMNIVVSDETDKLLETGGGLKKASWFFTGASSVVVRNVDVLSDLDLAAMAARHYQSNSLATLAVRRRNTSRYFLFTEAGLLCGWENRSSGEIRQTRPCTNPEPLAFSGIQILDPKLFALFPDEERFSLTSLYLQLSDVWPIGRYEEPNPLWRDVGTFPG